MRVQELKVYTFDELSEPAKERARDWWRRVAADDFSFHADDVMHDCADGLALIGIDIRKRPVKLMGGGTRMEPNIYYSGFSSRGDGASFSGSYAYVKGGARKLREDRPTGIDSGHVGNNEINRIASELDAVQRRHFYQIQARITASSYRGFGLDVDVEWADGRPVNSDDEETVREAMRDVASWIYRTLEREYEYQNADEQVDDTIRTNEYEFTEDGRRA